MRKFHYFWLIALLLGWPGCEGSPPVVTQNRSLGIAVPLNIDGPAEVSAGQLVRLIADIEPAESPFWIVLKPVNLDYEQVDNGQRLIFAVACEPPDDLIVMLLAQRVVNDRIVTRQLIRRIPVKSGTDLPSPVDPGEPLPVDPPLTDLPMYQAVLAAWKSIPSQSAKAKSNRVADNFANTAKLCAIGELTAIPDIWGTLAVSNARTLGPHLRDWEVVGQAHPV